MPTSSTLILALLLLAGTAHGATLRCGSQLISTGDRAFEVHQKCGPPVSMDVIGSSESYSSNYRHSEQVRIEEWVYGPLNGMYQYLRFEGGRLVRIDSKRGS
jgi:hypothetical protein